MNTAFTLAECFATAAFANRNPTWREYENGSPAEQRAIRARWQEIFKDDDHIKNWRNFSAAEYDARQKKCEEAHELWLRAEGRDKPILRIDDKFERGLEHNPWIGDCEEYEGEAEARGMDGRGFLLKTTGGE